jgi:hypothetical protein
MAMMHGGHRWSVLPSTRAGWWSLALLAGSLLSWLMFFSVAPGEVERDGLDMRLSTTTVVGFGAAILGAALGLAGVLRERERGLLVALPVIWGLLSLYFLVGELLLTPAS